MTGRDRRRNTLSVQGIQLLSVEDFFFSEQNDATNQLLGRKTNDFSEGSFVCLPQRQLVNKSYSNQNTLAAV